MAGADVKIYKVIVPSLGKGPILRVSKRRGKTPGLCNLSQKGRDPKRIFLRLGTRHHQGWCNVEPAKGSEGFSSIAGFNDSRSNSLNGPGQ